LGARLRIKRGSFLEGLDEDDEEEEGGGGAERSTRPHFSGAGSDTGAAAEEDEGAGAAVSGTETSIASLLELDAWASGDSVCPHPEDNGITSGAFFLLSFAFVLKEGTKKNKSKKNVHGSVVEQ
jgi:hypothetical protein